MGSMQRRSISTATDRWINGTEKISLLLPRYCMNLPSTPTSGPFVTRTASPSLEAVARLDWKSASERDPNRVNVSIRNGYWSFSVSHDCANIRRHKYGQPAMYGEPRKEIARE